MLRFRNYGSLTADRWPTLLDFKLPFYHLGTQGFWQPLTAEMQPAASAETCLLIDLDPQFYECLLDPGFRVKARMVLISKYFTQPEQAGLFESLGLQIGKSGPPPATDKVMEEATEYAKRKGRCARFAVRVVTAYRFSCALTGYQCTTADGASIVEAAHIEPWSKTQNDDITNGLALSKNAHWMFDEGLWTVDADYRIAINPPRFIEAGPDALKLQSYAGRSLQFAHNSTLRPNPSYFRSHARCRVF